MSTPLVDELLERLSPEDLRALADRITSGRQPDNKQKKYWRTVREKERELGLLLRSGRLEGHNPKRETIWLSSIEVADDPDCKVGIVTSATLGNAGKALVDRTHQIAGPQEIKAEMARREKNREIIEDRELQRGGRKQVIVMGHNRARAAGLPVPKENPTKGAKESED
jgi:hypothetical protein